MEFDDTFNQLRDVAQIVRKCPTATLKRALVQAARDYCNQSHWLRTKVSMNSSAVQSGLDGSYQLVLNDPEEAQYLEVTAIRDNIIGLDESGATPQEFRIIPGDSSTWRLTANAARPRFYAYRPEGMFDLYPTPDQGYDLTITAVVQPIENAARLPVDLMKKNSTQIQAGALEYLLALPGQPWTDKAEAGVQGRVFRAGINNAKADAQRRFNTGAQRLRPQRFIRL